MNPVRLIRRLGAVLAGLRTAGAGGLLAVTAASPALAMTAGNPAPDPGTGVPEPWPGANLPAAQVPPAIHTVTRTVVVGGMPGWQIALIAAAAALLGAALAVLTYRARDAHHKTALSMRQPDERDLISFLSSSFSCCRSAIQQSWYGSDPRMAR